MPSKLCYVCEATQGGVRKHLSQLIRVFSNPAEGFELHAIFGDRGEAGFREELQTLSALQNNFQYSFIEPLQREISLGRDTKAYTLIKEKLRELAPAIVHTHSSKAGFLGRQAAYHLGLKCVLHTPHVFPFQWAEGLKSRVYLALERYCAKHSRAVICVGESQRADAVARKVAQPEKLVVIRNGVELPAPIEAPQREKLRASLGLSSQPAIGMVARLAPQKGVGIFVRAAAKLLQQRPDAVFLVVGSGPLQDELRARAAELKLSADHFRLLGQREDAERLYPAFDLLVLSSLYEGLPYVLLEAMAWGVPVVATDVLGSRDVVVDGVTGLLAHPSDPEHIAQQMLRLLTDRALYDRCSAAARQRVADEFSFAAFVEGHRKLYNS